MTYKIYAREADGTPVPGATISVVGTDGFTKSAAAADATGLYMYDDAFSMALADGDVISAMADGYRPATMPYSPNSGRFDLIMEPVKTFNPVPIILIGLGLGVFAYKFYQHVKKR